MGNGKRSEEQIRKISRATSAALKRRAEQTKCPACGRKNAMQRLWAGPEVIGRVCRWCKHEIAYGHSK